MGQDCQKWLDVWADTILPGDFDRFRAMVALPFLLASPEGQWTVSDEARLRAGFDAYRAAMLTLGVTLIVRSLRQVETLADDHLRMSFDCHALRNGTRVLAPDRSTAQLRQQNGVWRATHLTELETEEAARSPLPQLPLRRFARPAPTTA